MKEQPLCLAAVPFHPPGVAVQHLFTREVFLAVFAQIDSTKLSDRIHHVRVSSPDSYLCVMFLKRSLGWK